MSQTTSESSICPCDSFVHPIEIFNPAGRSRIAYRVGDYITFRHALLLSLPGETELTYWRPGANGDLAVQMLEWWAYLADILTFYNERIANQSYLRTADLPESLHRLIRVLGYRPRPGIAAEGTLAALMNRPVPFTLLQGFPIQSKPGPGKQPQIFELNAKTLISPPDALTGDVEPIAAPLKGAHSVLLKGAVSTVKVGDELLFVAKTATASIPEYPLAVVQDVQQKKAPNGKINTQISFHDPLSLSQTAADYSLLKSVQSAHLWSYPADAGVVRSKTFAHLEAITRQIKVGAFVLFELSGATATVKLARVTSYSELVWNANTGKTSDPTQPPNPPSAGTLPSPPIPIPHSVIGFTEVPIDTWDVKQVLVRYNWQEVGQLIEVPEAEVKRASLILSAPLPQELATLQNRTVLLEDALGKGVEASATAGGNPPALHLALSDANVSLTQPLRVLFNLLSVSRGKTVPSEILGSGDATQAGQEFVLQKSPLTYRLNRDSTSGNTYASTLQVWVDSIEWQEVPSFYEQPSDARIFVTHEDENNQTHVLFGDGINGARLPSGVNNVVARYRYGSSADAPDAGQLTVITQPQPNLKALSNPVVVGGGADPDSPAHIRRLAPQSVLTFGRAVSGDDYEVIAAQAPGVTRARAYWSWNAVEQRTLVTVYVGDDTHARSAAMTALALAIDPNRPVAVVLARAIPVKLQLTLRLDPSYLPGPIFTAVTAALQDEDTGLFGKHVLRIGEPLYQSRLDEVCLRVPGTLAVHGLHFQLDRGAGFEEIHGYRYEPGEGNFFQLQELTLA